MRLGRILPEPIKAVLRPLRDRYRLRQIGLGSVQSPGDVRYLGTEYGGYAVSMGALDPESVCFCIGAGEDISFETALADTVGCTVHVIDPTPRAVAHAEQVIAARTPRSGRLEVQPVGMWSSNGPSRFYVPRDPQAVSHSIVNMQHTDDYFEAECLTPATLMDRLGLDHVDLVKLNIEGAEYEVMRAFFSEGIMPTTVCITFDELHSAIDGDARSRMRELMAGFHERGYTPIDARGAKVTFLRDASA